MPEPRPTVIAADPGLTTGWAALYPDGEFRSGEIRGAYEFLHRVYSLVSNRAFGWELVCERYIITPETIKKSRQHDPLEIIGCLKWFSKFYDIPLVLQSPSDAKNFAGDDKLKRMGWYEKGMGHANDAARHLLLHSVRVKYVDVSLLLGD